MDATHAIGRCCLARVARQARRNAAAFARIPRAGRPSACSACSIPPHHLYRHLGIEPTTFVDQFCNLIRVAERSLSLNR